MVSNTSPKKDSFVENAPPEFVITPKKAQKIVIPEQDVPEVEEIDDPVEEKEVSEKKDTFKAP